jgi:hypothetical protein
VAVISLCEQDSICSNDGEYKDVEPLIHDYRDGKLAKFIAAVQKEERVLFKLQYPCMLRELEKLGKDNIAMKNQQLNMIGHSPDTSDLQLQNCSFYWKTLRARLLLGF